MLNLAKKIAMKPSFFHFKLTFIFLATGIFTFMIINGLFTIYIFKENETLLNVVLKAAFVSVVTGLIMGILNMFFQINPFKKKL